MGGIISPAAPAHATVGGETLASPENHSSPPGMSKIWGKMLSGGTGPSLATVREAPATSLDKTRTCRRAELGRDESWCGSPAKVQVLRN